MNPESERLRAGALAAVDRAFPPRRLALLGVALVLGAYLSVLNRVMVVLGDPAALYAVVAVATLAGLVLSRVIRPVAAVAIGAGVIFGGTLLYVWSLPGGLSFLALVVPMLGDALSLLGGLSILRIVNADVWALTAAPGPVFLATYLALRRRYVTGTGVAAAALGLVVLTGDATTTVTFVGVFGATLSIAFGDCDRRDERFRDTGAVVVAVATIVTLTLFVGAAPIAAASIVPGDRVGQGSPTLESSLVYAGDSVEVTGAVQLSPQVRYRVEADREAYWRVAGYDRYTGDGWVRTGGSTTDRGLSAPPGETRTLDQEFTAATDIATLPAAWRPTGVDDVPVPVQVTPGGDLQPASPLTGGESYTVRSERPLASPGQLRDTGTDYPDEIEEQYTQLPSSTPNRVAERTERLTTNADNPYDTARVIEEWLKEERRYSLYVDEPSGDIADEFLFEMDAGYCTYYATTMAVMLRSQGIPARFVTGYSPGQQIDDGEWVVRGSNSHAWVEVYFPGHGWIEFDPTPEAARASTEQQRIDEARLDGDESVDTNETLQEAEMGPEAEGAIVREDTTIEERTPSGSDDEGFSLPSPSREQTGIGLAFLLGAIVGVRRSGLDRRARRAVWLRRPPDGDPEAIVEGVYRRIVYLRDREKDPAETPRAYLADADARGRRIGELYERARYGTGVTDAEAEEATAALESLLEERSRLPARLGNGDRGLR